MDELTDALESAADGAFVVDEGLEIIYANRAAKQILGYHPDEGLRVSCYQMLQGRDDQHRLVCHEYCRVARKIFAGQGVSSYDLQVHTNNGVRWLNMSVFHYRDKNDDRSYAVHLFRDITRRKREALLVDRLFTAAGHEGSFPSRSLLGDEQLRLHAGLTSREHEVLRLLAQGKGTREIAQQLSIAVNTARNHIQHVLEKLHVHSRVEAVVRAMEQDLFNR